MNKSIKKINHRFEKSSWLPLPVALQFENSNYRDQHLEMFYIKHICLVLYEYININNYFKHKSLR